MAGVKKSKNHHWWPVALQSYWANNAGDVSWVEPSGKTSRKRFAKRNIGFKIHGHTIFPGSVWESNFESEFDIDNEIHAIITALNALKPFGRTLSEFIALMRLIFKKDRSLHDMCKFYKLEEKLHLPSFWMRRQVYIPHPQW